MGWLDWLRPRRRFDLLFAAHDDAELCDAVFCALAENDNGIDVEAMEAHERVVTLVWHTVGLVGNGGFYYLFSADYRGDPGFQRTAAAFEVIGADAAHNAFLQALALFPASEPHADPDARKAHYGALPESTRHPIDRAFWRAHGEIEAKLAAWIRAHRPQLEAALRR